MDSNMSRGMCALCCTSVTLVIIGAITWGLVGIGGFSDTNLNVVNLLLSRWPAVEWIVYILVGLAGVTTILSWNKCCLNTCQRKGMGKEREM